MIKIVIPADGCDFGLGVIRGRCRNQDAPSCGAQGEPCCDSTLVVPEGETPGPEFLDEGPLCVEPNLTCDFNSGVGTCIECGRAGEPPCRGELRRSTIHRSVPTLDGYADVTGIVAVHSCSTPRLRWTGCVYVLVYE